MKILCLHGVGSSGAVLKRQMAGLRRSLDPSFELFFVDGPFECDRGPGVHEQQPGPFFSHTQGYSPAEILEAFDYLQDVLDTEGPFDGIFGFSQGAAIALSFLYQLQVEGQELPVKFACFFSTAMVFSGMTGVGDGMISKIQALQYDMRVADGMHDDDLSDDEQEFVDVMRKTAVDAAGQFLLPLVDLDIYLAGEPETIPRVMHPLFLEEKLTIPTVHVWGRNDFSCLVKMAEMATGICDTASIKTLQHMGLHDMPKGPNEIRSVIRLIDWATSRA